MVSSTSLILVLITGSCSHDLLFFDEFEFDFDLKNQDEWDHYNTNGNDDYISSIAKDTNKKYMDKVYDNEQILNKDKNLFSKLNYAASCSETMPLILKQLCVHWKYDQGFKYNFKTHPNAAATMQDTNWYYNGDQKEHDIISDAKTANKYYSLLAGNNAMRYIGDDSNWNEINYANSLSSLTLNNDESEHDYFENFGKGSFKQCRHAMRMRECVTFHLPSKRLTVNVQIARARKQRHNKDVPNNIYAAQQDINDEYHDYDEYEYENEEYYDEYEEYEDDGINSAYDYHGEFEYGDSMGYDHWSADVMKWKSFQCLNCMNNKRRALWEDAEDAMYDKYGDYTYLFNEYALDFDDDSDWNEISDDNNYKCSIAIPGFEHKLCVDNNAKGAHISFAAADEDDIDYGYYDMYGYDSYYYNIDHLYKRRLIYDEMEEFDDEIDAEYIRNLRNELSDINLHFLDDNSWDDITTIYDASHERYIRKCKSLQVSQLCAIHSVSNPYKSLTFKLKIGKYKYHRSQSVSHAMDIDANYVNLYDEDSDDTQQQQQHWIISDEIFDLDDDEWDDTKLWAPSQQQILTDMLHKIVVHRCRSHTYCLCQYVDQSFDDQRKHPCAKGKINEPQKVVHVMDDFVKTPKPEFIPLTHYKKSPLRIEFHYKPHIEHLHVVGGLPFFHRRSHRKRNMVPWYKYARYEGLRPKQRPQWLPHWMWREIGSHIHHDPRQVQRIMRDLKRKGVLKRIRRPKRVGLHERAEANGRKQGLVSKLKRKGKKIGDWFKKTFSANEVDIDMDDGYGYYYEYDEFLADELDGNRDDSDTTDMVNYMFPIMENAAKYIQPVFEAMNGMVGNTWNRLAESVGIRRRRMEEDYGEEYEEAADEDNEIIIDDWYDADDGLNWVMISDDLSREDLYEFESAQFEKIVKHIISSSGKQIKRRCMTIFGRQLCICQFLEYIHATKADRDHLCHPIQKYKPALKQKLKKLKKPTHKISKPYKIKIKPKIVKPISRKKYVQKPRKKYITKPRKKYKKRVPGNFPQQKLWIMKQSNKIRQIVNDGLPSDRPLWFPHYFWHWLHSAPHFHVFRHKRRVPWRASSAKIGEGDMADMDGAAHELDYNFYQYGDDEEVDYDALTQELDGYVDDDEDYYDNYDMDEDYEDLYQYRYDDDDDDDEYYGDNEYGSDNFEALNDESDGFGDDELVMNALSNGDDFLGVDDSLNDEMWRIETMFLFIFAGIIFCLLSCCFVWRSKWGDLIRKLNEQRINRNQRISQAQKRKQVLVVNNEYENESSSLNISDVAPLNINNDI